MGDIRELARAKVNLSLRVLGRRSDGYHELESLVAFAQDACDIVTLTVGPAGATPAVCVDGPFAGSIAGENLVALTLAKVAAAEPRLVLGDVHLTKHLPVAAGIGGGSADAAAVLRAVRRANPALANAIDWTALASRLGADVPVCLESRASVMSGIGERVSPLPALPRVAAVLVNPMVPVPADKTAQVFRRLRAPPLPVDAPRRIAPLALDDREAVIGHMRAVGNDLVIPARSVVPVIAEIEAALNALPGCRHAQLSGGGPTMIGVFDDLDAARSAADQLRQAHPAWWIVPTQLA